MSDALLDNFDPEKRASRRNFIIFLVSALILTTTSVIFIILYFKEKNEDDDDNNDYDNGNYDIQALSLWNNNNSKKRLIDFVRNIKKTIPKEDRIAVFDLDGTLFQETDPIYTDFKLYKYRVLDDPDYKNKATQEQIDVANEIVEIMKTRVFPKGIDLRHAKCFAQSIKDMTIEEFYEYAKKFLQEEAEGYNNLKRGEAFYQPMLQVIEYLKSNGFTVYVVSGTDRFLVRAIVDGHINIPKNQIIGTDTRIVASQQDGVDGFNYTYIKDDDLIFKGEFLIKNLQMNKVHNIIKQIGKIPILSFGNSNGDSSMANLAISNGRGLAFMLLCDDLEREEGNEAKAKSMEESCNKNGWIPVSMKNDWKSIYGENVTRKIE